MMTNEEAIMILKAMIDEMILVFDRDRKKALNMAIEALKAQLSNTSEIPNGSDLISRQDAITAIIGLPTWYYDSDRHYGDPQPPMEALLDPEDVVNAIENLPPAKQEQKAGRWIPCSERLPDTNRDVLLQFNNNIGVGFLENGEWGVNTGDNIYSEIGEGEAKPIAWMELPEPYKR